MDILKRMRDRNEAAMRIQNTQGHFAVHKSSSATSMPSMPNPLPITMAKEAKENLKKPATYSDQSLEGENSTASKVLLFEEEELAVSGGDVQLQGGGNSSKHYNNTQNQGDDGRWFSCLSGGEVVKKEAKDTEAFLMKELARTREENEKSKANAVKLQQQLSSLQTLLESVKVMIAKSNKNVAESEQVLKGVQDASLEIVRARAEILLLQQKATTAATQAKAFEKNAESSARAAQEAFKIETSKKARVIHGDLERAQKHEDECKKKVESAQKVLEKEQALLDKLRVAEKKKRVESEDEQGRYSKLKSYAEILILNAQNASNAANEANEKLAFLLASESKAQDTLVKYKDHAREVIDKSKRFENSNKGKMDDETLKTIGEIHAYETETATVIVQTMKLIEKLHAKIEKALAHAQESEKEATLKAKDAKNAEESLTGYASVLEKSLKDAMTSLGELRDAEAKFERVRSNLLRAEDELERAREDTRVKLEASKETQDEARQALREMQMQTEKQLKLQSNPNPQPEATTTQTILGGLNGGETPTVQIKKREGVFVKIKHALQSLKRKNTQYVTGGELCDQVMSEIDKTSKVEF